MCGAGALVVVIAVLWNNWAPLLGAWVLLLVALMAVWYVVDRAWRRACSPQVVIAVAAIAVAFATLSKNHSLGDIVLAVVLIVAFGWLARAALRSDPAVIGRRTVARRSRSVPRTTRS